MDTIAYPSPDSINSSTRLADIVPIRAGAVREEDDAPYDGQSKGERQCSAHMTSVRDDVLDELVARLGLPALGLYTYLERRVNKRGQCTLSYSRIADDTKSSRRHIIDLMKVLADAGYVRIMTPPDTQRTHTPNTFTLPFHPQQKLVQNMHQPSERASERASAESAPKVVSKYSPSKTPPLPPNGAPANDDARLDEASERRMRAFIAAYPVNRRRYNPRDLAVLWASLSAEQQQAAIAGVQAWSTDAEWTKEHGRYVPGMVRFLAERGWESAPASPPSTGNKTVDLLRSMGI